MNDFWEIIVWMKVKGNCETQKMHVVESHPFAPLIRYGLKYSPPKTDPQICASLFIHTPLPFVFFFIPI